MRYRYYITVVLFFVTGLSVNGQGVSNDNEDEVNKIDTRFAKNDFVPGQVLVKFKDANRVQIRRSQGQFASTNIDKITEVMQKYGVSDMGQLLPNERPDRQLRRAKAYNGDVIQEHDLSQLYCVKLSAEHQHETMQVVDELKSLDEVEFAEPNYRVYMMADTHIADDYSGNPMESQQWYLDAYGVKELWNKPIINKERPVIAILDTGVDLTHPDLKDNLWTNIVEEYGTKDNDNDGNGFKNDVHGWDFVNNTANIRDYNMHGTHVAGIAAAANNGIGIIGANPQALLMPITVLQSDGSGDIATIIKGIDYAVKNGASVLNMSLGTYVNSLALRQALESAYQKAVLVAAAGNDGRCIYTSHWNNRHFDPEPHSMPCFPAAYSFVLGVQAMEKGGSVASFSNYDDDGAVYSCESSLSDPDGFNYELKAPGKKMLSTIPGGNYKELNGTSMSAPLVAGAISALKMVKQYDTQEILWGDLLHTDNIAQAFSLSSRPAELDLIKIELRERKELSDMTEEDYGGDNEVDAGELVSIYPVIRTTFGAANNIKMKVVVDEYEDPDVVDILSGEVDFGIHLDAYGKAVSKNPIILKISNSIADARHIRLKVVATCDEMAQEANLPFTLVAHNMIKIHGLITKDMTLTSDHVYYVNGSIGVNKGVTLTIEPGTRLEFAEGTSLTAFGKLIAKGTPQNPIFFTRHAGEGNWNGIKTHEPEGKHIFRGIYTNTDTTLFTLLPTDETPIYLGTEIKRNFYYDNSNHDYSPSIYLELSDYIGGDGWNYSDKNMSGKKNRLKDPTYLTPFVLRVLKDCNDYCNKYSQSKTLEYNESGFVCIHLVEDWVYYDNPGDTISFCRIEDCYGSNINMNDCVLQNSSIKINGERILCMNSTIVLSDPAPRYNHPVLMYSNIVNNKLDITNSAPYSWILNNNYFNNYGSASSEGKEYSLCIRSSIPMVDKSFLPSYLGTSREDLVRPYIYETGNTDGSWSFSPTWGTIDLSNMPSEPIKEAHGIVWKVLVDGKDAQDEFEDLPPLGVGKHKFEVYFNRPMNKTVAPQISFGVRDPYTQQSVAEDGKWNDDGTIYTAYKTITGKTNSDGLNRIYVTGAEDNEFFPCPYEKTRFNIMIQAAGSMSTGFEAEAGLGRIALKWNNEGNHFEDAMGFNVYRYNEKYYPAGYRNGRWHAAETVLDTMRINRDILDIETTKFVDYDVEPGQTYYYYYKVLSTDLQEFDASNVVSATPLTSTRGDVNGSGEVDVADVITTVNYITKQNPQPFIFEAADVNTDNIIDILDVMGIVKGILNPSLLAASMTETMANYTIEDGILYVESNVALGGVQVQLTIDGRSQMDDVRVAEDLDGFERASAWLSDNDYLFLAYSMNGKTLTPGKHALLYIGDAEISSLRLSDTTGKNINVSNSDGTTGVDRMGKHVMNVNGVYDLQGRKLSSDTPLKKGIYIINGKKVVK